MYFENVHRKFTCGHVAHFFHSIFLIFQNDHLIEHTYFLNDSEVFNFEGCG
jgi:hypothetical protein